MEASMVCPVCNVALSMTAREGVEIDYCPKCRGVWLDRGELDKIIERSAAETVQARPAERAPHYEERGRKRHHGRRSKSWLHELFD